jgi:transposase
LTHKTANQIYLKIRVRLVQDCQRQSPFADESYFGARRVKGKRGRGAGSKTIVLGIYKRNGKVFSEIVPNSPEENVASHYSRSG